MDTEVILFDLGGVLVEVAPAHSMADSPEDLPDAETIDRLAETVPQVKGFEDGSCSEEEFSVAMVEAFDLPWSPPEFMERFSGLVTRAVPGTEEFVAGLADAYCVCCLSNTNPVHWRRACEVTTACEYFERAYLSYEIGHMKPALEIYRHVIDDLGVAAEKILFFDDLPENIRAARNCGIRAVQVASLEDMQESLRP